MILHVVLYRPRADLPADAARAFAAALADARRRVPSIRQFWIGRRLKDSPAYLLSGFPDFPYAAVAAFDNRDGLLAYLRHDAHDAVSRAFNGTAEAALIYDYEVIDPAQADAAEVVASL